MKPTLPVYPGWVTLPYTAFVIVLVPVYWHHYGPSNFLWFSDIALFAVLVSLWTGNRLLFSMMAAGVLPLEILWTLDFASGGNLLGTAAYMFDGELPVYLRLISLFHLFLPPIIIWMLFRQGYDQRALAAQIGLAWVVLPLTWLITTPEDNINSVYGPTDEPQTVVPPVVYLVLYMGFLPVFVYLPMHLVLKRLFAEDA